MDTSFLSLHNEDLGDWSELGVLSVLSILQQEFYRARLVQSLANAAIAFEDNPPSVNQMKAAVVKKVAQEVCCKYCRVTIITKQVLSL
ncbi:hypothetical protein ACEYW6_32195 [Nostoc sp. UIC 10607]|uniref:Uncharacterized protein n=1 Tax=Nostoc foliaceum FACHB-393 TaxID=2692915 RepID=A0ABR8IL04_9NOSO|nr:hypothetical protein [Nostoc foliaceum]MBD2651512.1 hypothetical protein [Nostoc foliaceum FACHB-393]